MAKVSLVVPVYHNAASLPTLLERFQALAERNADDTFEFVFVDDGSKDQSFATLESLLAGESRMRIIKLARNFGSNAAIRAGLSAATGDAVVAIAADLQDPPELIDEMLAHWRKGREVVLATRATRDDPFMTSIMANIFYTAFRRLAIASMPKGGFDFFLIDARVRDRLLELKDANPYMMGQILWLGFEAEIVHYHRREREKKYGRSMWTFFRKIKYFIDAFVSFSYAPIRMVTVMGGILGLAGLFYAAWVLVLRLTGDTTVPGWSSLMVVILLISGVQMMMMGLLGEYLWRNLEQSRARPSYIVERELAHPLKHEVEPKGGIEPREREVA